MTPTRPKVSAAAHVFPALIDQREIDLQELRRWSATHAIWIVLAALAARLSIPGL